MWAVEFDPLELAVGRFLGGDDVLKQTGPGEEPAAPEDIDDVKD
jgi:hypothetical protein